MRINITDFKPNEVFKFIRQSLNITQEQMAKDLKIGRSSIQQYEYGTLNYTFEVLYKIAKKYNLKITLESR